MSPPPTYPPPKKGRHLHENTRIAPLHLHQHATHRRTLFQCCLLGANLTWVVYFFLALMSFTLSTWLAKVTWEERAYQASGLSAMSNRGWRLISPNHCPSMITSGSCWPEWHLWNVFHEWKQLSYVTDKLFAFILCQGTVSKCKRWVGVGSRSETNRNKRKRKKKAWLERYRINGLF